MSASGLLWLLVGGGEDDDGPGGGGGQTGPPAGSPPTQKFEGPWFSTQMILSLGIGLTSFLVFCFLRTRWEIVYMGRTKLKDFSPTPAHTPDVRHGTFFGWILPTLRTSEFTVLQTVGLDAAVLLNFYRMAFFLFTLLACLAGAVLMPLNLFRHGSTDSEYNPVPGNDTDHGGNYTLVPPYSLLFAPNEAVAVPPNNGTRHSHQTTYDYLLDPQLSNTINMLFTYIFTALTLIFLHRNFHRFVQSRQSFALHLIHSISARTVLVTNVPQHLRGDRALADYFEGCGWVVESVNICREVEPLRRILERRTDALLKLEQAWVEWVGNPANARGHDPSVYGRLGKGKQRGFIQSAERDSATTNTGAGTVEGVLIPDLDDDSNPNPDTGGHLQAETTLGTSPARVTSPDNPQGEEINPLNGNSVDDVENGECEYHIHVHTDRPRPTIRPRWFGVKVDAIEYWEKRFRRADHKVREMRMKGRFGATHVAFVTFENAQDAQTACQVVHFPQHSEVITAKAPEPRDVVWSLVSISQWEGRIREVIVMVLMGLLLIFWIPPVASVASLLSYKEIKRVLPWLARLIDKSPRLEAIVQNSLPSVGLVAFNGLLPFLLGWLSYHQGLKSRSAIEYSLLRKYHLFLLVTVLFIFLLTTTFWALVRDLADTPARIPEKLASALLGSNAKPFMISYVMLQSMGLMPLQILNLGPLLTLGWGRLFSVKTPRDYAESNAPPMLNYGWVYPQALLIFTITLSFSVVMPLILIFGALYFGVAYLVYKYKLLFIYFKPYESNGEAWRITFHRLLWAVVIFQVFMAGLFSLQKPYWLFFTMIPLVVFTLWWSYTTDKDFKGLSEYVAMSSICEVARGEGADQVVGVEDSVSRSQASLNHRRYAVNDETLYVAPSDKRTDYSQPPMNNFYYGVLNTGRRRYAHPALTGSLPFPWLPAKAVPKKFGDGAAQRRGVVLSLRRKVARKLRRSQAASESEHEEGGGSGRKPVPEGWATGESLSASQDPTDTDVGHLGGGDSDAGSESGAKAGGPGSSVSSITNPWRDPTPEASTSTNLGAGKVRKSKSYDPASGVIALPDEDNVWLDAEDGGEDGGDGSGSESGEGEQRGEDDEVPESPSTYFPHPERMRTISSNDLARTNRAAARSTDGLPRAS